MVWPKRRLTKLKLLPWAGTSLDRRWNSWVDFSPGCWPALTASTSWMRGSVVAMKREPGAHLQARFVGLDDLLTGTLVEGGVDAVEDGIVLNFRHQEQGGLGNLERVAVRGRWDGNHLRVIKADREAELAAQRGEHLL